MKNKVVSAAMGLEKFDLVIKNINYVNLFTKEVYKADIGIVKNKIAHITAPKEEEIFGIENYDGKEKYALPGLIDTHVHIESSMMTPSNFARAVLPHGTTTVIADPHEIANVLGVDGVKYMLSTSKNIPLNVFMLAPSCIPSLVSVETGKCTFAGKDIYELMNHPRVIGLGEVMDFHGVINQSDRMVDILNNAKKFNKFIQGHAPGLVGKELSAYLASGCESCHETHTYEEAVSKLRAGMVLECRYSSGFKDIEALAKAIIEFNYPENVTLCTDDREPDDLLSKGHIDEAIRIAIKSGIPPIEAIKMATINAARLGRIYDRGSIKAGNIADIILVENLESFKVDDVFVSGNLVAKNGKMLIDFKAPHYELKSSIILKRKPLINDFRIHIQNKVGEIKANAIKFNKDDFLFTKLTEVNIPIKDGYMDIENTKDLSTFVNFERHGVNGNISICPAVGLGLTKGAIATTISHDCHNLFVVGKSPEDMLLAASTLIEAGGGVACVCNGKVECLLELPIAGLMSHKTIQELAPKVEEIKKIITKYGVVGESPLLLLLFFALPVIPEARLTDMGIVNVYTKEIIPVIKQD